MNQNISQFHDVLAKYRFAEPVPSDVQIRIRNSKGPELNRILKRANAYSLWFAMIAGIFFNLKKMGFHATIMKSLLILAGGSLIFVSGMTTGAYYLYNTWAARETVVDKIKQPADNAGAKPLPSENKGALSPAEEEAIRQKLAIMPFTAENVGPEQARFVTDTLARKLADIRGADRVFNYRLGRVRVQVGRMVMGSVEKLGDVYTLNARLVDVKDSRILFYTTENVENLEQLEAGCEKLARNISAKMTK